MNWIDTFVFALGLICGVVISMSFEETRFSGAVKEYHSEAVTHHAAYWETDSSGNSKFIWREDLPPITK